MHGEESLQTNDLIKPVQYAVQIINQIVSSIPRVACIKADTDLLFAIHTIDDLPQFFKASAHFGSFSCHRFQQYDGLNLRGDDLIQSVTNHLDTFFSSLSCV